MKLISEWFFTLVFFSLPFWMQKKNKGEPLKKWIYPLTHNYYLQTIIPIKSLCENYEFHTQFLEKVLSQRFEGHTIAQNLQTITLRSEGIFPDEGLKSPEKQRKSTQTFCNELSLQRGKEKQGKSPKSKEEKIGAVRVNTKNSLLTSDQEALKGDILKGDIWKWDLLWSLHSKFAKSRNASLRCDVLLQPTMWIARCQGPRWDRKKRFVQCDVHRRNHLCDAMHHFTAFCTLTAM